MLAIHWANFGGDATLASVTLKRRHMSNARSKSNGRLLVLDASDARPLQRLSRDRRGLERARAPLSRDRRVYRSIDRRGAGLTLARSLGHRTLSDRH
jgi:hypothetical protein